MSTIDYQKYLTRTFRIPRTLFDVSKWKNIAYVFTKLVKIAIVSMVLVYGCYANLVFAQGVLTLSVSPTSFEMVVNPGQEWKSTIDIANVNDFDLTVYAEVVNFVPKKGGGNTSSLLPILDSKESDSQSLAGWIEITREPIVIQRQTTKKVPFIVRVPKEADPGSHFAAIFIGTKSINADVEETRVQASQIVTSLFSVDVTGEVIESVKIREFSSEKKIYSRPEVTLNLIFENESNVRIHPLKDIRVYNMFGQERGVISIENEADFGKILPNSTKYATLTWADKFSFYGIGRYSAVLNFKYGKDESKFISSKTYFWILPIKEILIVIFSIILLITILFLLLRYYVSRMLRMVGVDLDNLPNKK